MLFGLIVLYCYPHNERATYFGARRTDLKSTDVHLNAAQSHSSCQISRCKMSWVFLSDSHFNVVVFFN